MTGPLDAWQIALLGDVFPDITVVSRVRTPQQFYLETRVVHAGVKGWFFNARSSLAEIDEALASFHLQARGMHTNFLSLQQAAEQLLDATLRFECKCGTENDPLLSQVLWPKVGPLKQDALTLVAELRRIRHERRALRVEEGHAVRPITALTTVRYYETRLETQRWLARDQKIIVQRK